jgi:hypothetical protein
MMLRREFRQSNVERSPRRRPCSSAHLQIWLSSRNSTVFSVWLTPTFQPRRLILAPAAVGCKCLLANGQLEARAKVHGRRVLDVKDSAWLVVARLG